ncbi:hypothetical protein TVAG_475050 [Trichomonas vaginalis G3]|uniref:Uncharacterized protein n=1 Tax=Trichomonas vaginalis (strain ATCC PRA-98 / G3) TaxID=412133 RepID=A2EM12_TRIV3|nr:hypothetical protein TVAGG3_0613230 [Trichomonas vaginalis G3]EAY06271.1 hypothetical protein TVAG_475050 [Trichomonas vaginalis G3]KAI5503349.1 hypothetical protein TVAGG3_0613230 [Trichomonas vaginalis G3]|eukprot:XP_001318494.1 hypothetical protein [Trichomonas vaginalis G3]
MQDYISIFTYKLKVVDQRKGGSLKLTTEYPYKNPFVVPYFKFDYRDELFDKRAKFYKIFIPTYILMVLSGFLISALVTRSKK